MFGHFSFILIAKIEPFIIDTSCNCAHLETSTVFIGGLGQKISNIKNCSFFPEISISFFIHKDWNITRYKTVSMAT